MSKYEVFSGPYFPAFGPEKTPYLDTFHVVRAAQLCEFTNGCFPCSRQRLNLKTFERWLRKENKEDTLVDYLESTEVLQLINNTEKTSFDAAIDSCECTFELFLHFDQSICSKFAPMFVFWKSFIKITQISLNYIKSTCTGDWSLHLQASERMLVWFFCI